MSLLSFFNREKQNVALVINVNNGSINSSLVSFGKNKTPEYLYAKETQFAGEKPDATKLSQEVCSLLDSSLNDVIKNGWSKMSDATDKRISHVIVSFSSPWVMLKVKNIYLSNETPFIISKRFVDDVIQKEEAMYKNELQKNYPEDPHAKFSIVEKSIIHTKINGYIVDNLTDKKTKLFDASILMTAISEDVEKKVSDIILKHTHIPKENILMHSFPLIFYSAVRDNLDAGSDHVLINVDSEITDIILVENHIIKSISSFPFGKNTIHRQVAKSSNLSLEVAESQLLLYLSEKTDNSVSAMMQNVLLDLQKEWMIYLEDALISLSPELILPKKTYLVADKSISPIILKLLKPEEPNPISSFVKNIDIVSVDIPTLSHFFKNSFNLPIDEPLVLLTIFYNKFVQSD